MPRLPDIDPDKLTPAQRAAYDRILDSPRGRVEGPLRVWVRSPAFAEKAQALGTYCRFGSTLPPRLSELAILVIGAYYKSGFEFWAHAPLAIAGGLDAEIVEAIRVNATPVFEKADETAVYDFAHELVRTRRVSDAKYKAVHDALGESATIDLVGILGYYALISMTINVFEVPLPPGEKDPFAP